MVAFAPTEAATPDVSHGVLAQVLPAARHRVVGKSRVSEPTKTRRPRCAGHPRLAPALDGDAIADHHIVLMKVWSQMLQSSPITAPGKNMGECPDSRATSDMLAFPPEPGMSEAVTHDSSTF